MAQPPHTFAVATLLGALLALPAGAEAPRRPAPDAFAAAARALAEAPGLGTCFGGFLLGHPAQAAIERATVLIEALDESGRRLWSGSGFVVAGSADADGAPAVVTAQHVVAGDGASAPSHFAVYGSDASALGLWRVVAAGAPPDAEYRQTDGEGAWNPVPADWAVLRPEPDAAAPLQAPPGLALHPAQAAWRTIGPSGGDGRPAASSGISGGPVVDGAGRVVGIASAVRLQPGAVAVRVEALMAPAFGNERSAEVLVAQQPLVVTPLSDPRLLDALGPGVIAAASADAPLLSGAPLTLAGMPGGRCVASPTVQGPLDADGPDGEGTVAEGPAGASVGAAGR